MLIPIHQNTAFFVPLNPQINKLQYAKLKSLITKEYIRKAQTSFNRLNKKSTCLPHDWRFNSIIISHDVRDLLRELIFNYSLLEAAYELYKSSNPPGKNLSDYDFFTNLYAGQLVLQIYTTKEKMKICCATYFKYVDLTEYIKKGYFEDLEEELQNNHLDNPLKRLFFKILKVDDEEHWKEIVKYRHWKTHRLGLSVSIYGVESHHGWGLMKKLSDQEVKEYAKNAFEKGGSKDDKAIMNMNKDDRIAFYLNSLKIDDEYYMRFDEERLVAYSSFEETVRKCIEDLFSLADELYVGLSKVDFSNKIHDNVKEKNKEKD